MLSRMSDDDAGDSPAARDGDVGGVFCDADPPRNVGSRHRVHRFPSGHSRNRTVPDFEGKSQSDWGVPDFYGVPEFGVRAFGMQNIWSAVAERVWRAATPLWL